MTEAYPTDLERRVLRVPCGYCEAEAGVWCRSNTGGPSTILHKKRSVAAALALGETSTEADYRRAQELLEAALVLVAERIET